MQRYSAKPIKDEDDVLIGFEKIRILQSSEAAPVDFEILHGEKTKFPKAEQQPSEYGNIQWVIVHDQDAQDAADADDAQMQTLSDQAKVVRDNMLQLRDDIQNLSTVAGIKPILLSMWKAIAFLLKKEFRDG